MAGSSDTAVLNPTDSTSISQPRARPFGIGEKISYQVKFGIWNVGKGAMEVLGVESVRNKHAWKVQLSVDGGVPLLYHLKSTYTSWMDTTTLFSLRYVADQEEQGKPRDRFFEIFPERSVFRQKIVPDTLPEMASVPDPLDEASFLYFIRTVPLKVGDTLTFDRYFRPDRNPVVIRVLRRELVSVPAGEFPALVLQPTIKTNGLFSEGGKAKIWISDDPARIILKIQSEVASVVGSLHLNMTAYTPGLRRQ
jgi:hypothetical protein